MHRHFRQLIVSFTMLGLACWLSGGANRAFAQATAVTFSGTTYTQNFDGITTGQTSSIASAAPGWSFFRTGTSAGSSIANPIVITPTYASGSNTTAVTQNAGTVGTGVVTQSSSGGAYLWVSGTLASGTDKSIGYLSTGSYPGTTAYVGQQLAILFGFTNTTGATITTLDLAWNYERYRMGSRTQGWEFYTSTDGSTWSANSLGNATFSGTNTAIVYNPPESSAKAVSIPSLSISNGSNYYLRWSFVTTGSWTNSQGLGIDDFTMNLTTSGSGVSTDLYWDGATGWNATAPGAGGTGTWADGSGSWDPTKKANFGGTADTVTAAIVTASNGLAFTTSGYTLTGGTITLAAASSGLNSITTGTDGSVTTSIDSVLAGSAGLLKLGQGTLVLGGANTFSGGLTLSSGTLQISSDGNLGDAAGPVTLNSTLKTTSSVSLGSGRTVSGGATLDIAPGTTLTSSGSFNLTATTLSNSGTLSLQGATRSVGVLTFGTAATVNASGAVSLTGLTATAVTSGSAIVNPAITFTSGDKAVDVGSGGTLVLNGDIAGTTGRIAKTGAGTLVVSGSNTTSGYRVGAAGASPTNGGTVILAQAASSGTNQLQLNYGTLQASAPLTFTTGLSVGGRTGAVAVLGGTNAMTFSGSSSFFRGTATSGELRLDVNNVTTLSGVFGPTSGGGTATGVTIGGNGQLIMGGNASGLLDTITITDTLLFTLSGSIGGGLAMAGSSILDGGGGLMAGNLSFTTGSKLLLDTANPTLTVNGPSVSFVNFTISNIEGLDSSTPAGSYDLIGGPTFTGTNGLANIGPTAAFDLGGGVSAYYLPNSITAALTLIVVPEPVSSVLTGLGVATIVLFGRRRRTLN